MAACRLLRSCLTNLLDPPEVLLKASAMVRLKAAVGEIYAVLCLQTKAPWGEPFRGSCLLWVALLSTVWLEMKELRLRGSSLSIYQGSPTNTGIPSKWCGNLLKSKGNPTKRTNPNRILAHMAGPPGETPSSFGPFCQDFQVHSLMGQANS